MAAPIREALLLVKSGFPVDVAFQMDETIRAAFCIVLCELDGAKFDWNRMAFPENR